MWLHYFLCPDFVRNFFSHFFLYSIELFGNLHFKKIIMLTTLVRLNKKQDEALKKEEQQQQRQLVRDKNEN